MCKHAVLVKCDSPVMVISLKKTSPSYLTLTPNKMSYRRIDKLAEQKVYAPLLDLSIQGIKYTYDNKVNTSPNKRILQLTKITCICRLHIKCYCNDYL